MSKIEVGVSFSENPDVEEAVREASIKLRAKFSSAKIDLCLVFFSFSKEEVKKLFPNIKLVLNPSLAVGCSLPLLIAEKKIFSKGLILIAFSNTRVIGGLSPFKDNILEDTEKFIWRLVRRVKGERRFFLCLANISGFSPDFLRGLERGLGRNFPLLGLFSHKEYNLPSFLLYNEDVLRGEGIAGLLFLDDLEAFFEINSGFTPLGKEAFVDSFSKDTIYRIDNSPAVYFYKNYFGEKVESSEEYFQRVSRRYPLGFKTERFPSYIVSSPVKLNPDGSFKLFKEVPSSRVRLTIPIRDKLISCVEETVKKAKFKSPKVAIFFEGFNRFRFLKFFYPSQLEALKNLLGDIPLVGGVGFYHLGLLSSFDLDLGHFIGENSFSLFILGDK